MQLSPSQVNRFWREWSAAIRYQRWKDTLSPAQIDAKRKELLARAGFSSLTKVDRRNGFDKVLTELRILQDDVTRTVEAADATIPQGRRLAAVIRLEILPCLALYEDDVYSYLATVITGLMRLEKTDEPERPPILEDLDTKPTVKTINGKLVEVPSQLEQAMMTLNARLHAKRKSHKHTIHTMKIKAGVRCFCSQCVRPKVVYMPAAAPVMAGAPDPDNEPF